MKKFIIFSLLFFVNISLFAQKDLSLKIGGSYYINCQKTIVFGNQPIMSMTGDDVKGRKISFDVYSPEGILDASLNEGKFTGPRADAYSIVSIPDGFYIEDTRNQRIALKIVRVENKKEERFDFHVWGDFFLPNGERFQCSPEDSNHSLLQMLKGATFARNRVAIQLN